MSENGSKRRDWVKNAAIIFLSVMLVLTFFSNTFMNYSLPEVAAQYVQPGTITEKIRGSGTIESGDPYNIQVNETRTVESVLVRVGDTVQKGDILFMLADKESSELKAAEDTLDALMLDFELQLLNGSVSTSVANNVQSGNISSLSENQSKIVAAEAEIEKWQKEVDYAQSQVDYLSNVQSQIANSKPDTAKEEQKLAAAQAAYNADPVKQAYEKIAQLDTKIAECDQVIEKFKPENNPVIGYDEEVSGGNVTYHPIYEVKQEDYLQAANNRTIYVEQRNKQLAIVNDATAKAQYDKLQKELSQAQTDLSNAQNSVEDSSAAIRTQLSNWNLELSNRQKSLDAANEAKNQLLSDIAAELNLDSKMDQIREQQETIDKLREQATGTVIEAPISGTISSINIIAGQDTVAGSAIATMQPEGAGYTMSFSVTTEQARKLNPGIQAELVNNWRYDDVVVTLTKIMPDPSDPSQRKNLVFDVTGSVTAGQSLNVAVGDKSANYDLTVPNSAIREDSNGKFILIVETKSSPLGNRYKATRVDVEVLASDDTKSAISGLENSYEFVITTSTKPVTAGQLVRLAEQ